MEKKKVYTVTDILNFINGNLWHKVIGAPYLALVNDNLYALRTIEEYKLLKSDKKVLVKNKEGFYKILSEKEAKEIELNKNTESDLDAFQTEEVAEGLAGNK